MHCFRYRVYFAQMLPDDDEIRNKNTQISVCSYILYSRGEKSKYKHMR